MRETQLNTEVLQLGIGEVSNMFHTSERMLRHWEVLGLLTPARNTNGYRIYRSEDLNRLRRLLIYKELGIPATRITQLLDASAPEVVTELKKGRDDLGNKIRRLLHVINEINRLIDMAEKGTPMASVDDTDTYQEEARQRWGNTKQWMEYAEHQASTGKKDKERDEQHMHNVELQLAEAKRRGVNPGSTEANALAEEHRHSLTYYEVSPSMHVCLGRMYVTDQRFRKYYDAIEAGLAQWLHAVIDANAANLGIDLDHVQWQ